MLTPVDSRRRWFGLFFLLVAGGLLIWGQTILDSYLGRGIGFVLYWLVCFVFTGLAVLTALLDLWIVRRRARIEKQRLLQLAEAKPKPPSNQVRSSKAGKSHSS